MHAAVVWAIPANRVQRNHIVGRCDASETLHHVEVVHDFVDMVRADLQLLVYISLNVNDLVLTR